MTPCDWCGDSEPGVNARLVAVKFSDTGRVEAEDAMRKLTGRIPLLPLKEQEALYGYLETEYHSLLEQMKAAGENALEAQTLDLRAQTVERREWWRARPRRTRRSLPLSSRARDGEAPRQAVQV